MIEASRDRAALIDRFWRINPKHIVRRDTSGYRHGRRKLTDDQVRDIRTRYAEGERPYTMAADYPVAPKNVWRVAKGVSYRWVE